MFRIEIRIKKKRFKNLEGVGFGTVVKKLKVAKNVNNTQSITNQNGIVLVFVSIYTLLISTTSDSK